MAGGGEDVPPLSFLDKVRFMMYGEQEKEAFLLEKKEKEEKKKGMRTRALSLHQQGWSWTKIATELGCHRTTVMRLVHKWQQTGCISDLPHRRKPPHHPHHNQNQLAGNTISNRSPCPLKPRWPPPSPPRGGAPRPSGGGGRSTTVTVRRRLKELRSQLGIATPPSQDPLPLPPPPPRPQPDRSKPDKTLEEVSRFSADELARIIFSDMKVFLCDRSRGVRVWRGVGGGELSDFLSRGGLTAAFWVCVSGSGRRGRLLHVPDQEELTEERYVQILHNGLLPSAAHIYGLDAHGFLFARDPRSLAASPAVEDFLRQQHVQCAEWPSRAPDLNPCDLLWPEVEAALRTARPVTSQELVEAVRNAYEGLDAAYVQWLVAPVRLRSLCRRMMGTPGRL